MTTNIFEYASRKTLRFDSPRGLLTVEQLWALPLTAKGNNPSLNSVGITIRKKIQEAETESLVAPSTTASTDDTIAFEIVKHIIDVKQKEEAARVESATKASQRKVLMDLIEQKQNEELAGRSVEELYAELAKLD